ALGGAVDGVLAEYRLFPAQALVRTPEHLSDIEAAGLPCAGLTAWSAVVKLGDVKPGQTVLTQGTGGVSLFGECSHRDFQRISEMTADPVLRSRLWTGRSQPH